MDLSCIYNHGSAILSRLYNNSTRQFYNIKIFVYRLSYDMNIFSYGMLIHLV